jgi:cyclopropane-fatty-acyl-phospholipid synthase
LRESTLNPAKNNFKTKVIFPDIARKTILSVLKNIKQGCLVIEEGSEKMIFGELSSQEDLRAHAVVHDPKVYSMMLRNGDLGAGEAYMLGLWSSPQVLNVVRIFVSNMHALERINGQKSLWQKFSGSLTHWMRENSQKNAKQNIAAHYDLSNDFFSHFLDETMAYSSGIFLSDEHSLQQASEYKFKHICDRLQLNELDHLLEIGTGWGGLAIYAAKHYGCRVTTTTLSEEQFAYAKKWVAREGLEDKINLLLKDYRDLEGRFDKLVSVEMIEAVGAKYYSKYFSKCNELLNEDGLMLIQAITISDQRFQQSVKSMDFIKCYIFPGGQLPSNSVISKHIANDTNMQLVGMEDITLDYAKTLMHWRKRFFEKIDEVKQLGVDDTFIRMWEYYLCFCEGGFRERVIHTGQFLMAKPGFRALPRIKVDPS